ncbi:Two-component response regulator ARR8 [Acorus gramineus]|uniref:Two-component response regulator ARR8 n=1 Tax=Acorus gramineus TaxID=55184 RepID=A0AAV9BE96_ACOGR|nr:Two-component response regulator ARR8 [Acorus gramineus]
MEEENRVRVLVVDDCPVDRKVVERLLKNGSFEVIVVNSGKKAMEVLGLHEEMSPTINDQRFDIILTDYCMPEMTGYDLLKVIKLPSSRGRGLCSEASTGRRHTEAERPREAEQTGGHHHRWPRHTDNVQETEHIPRWDKTNWVWVEVIGSGIR